VIDEYAVWRPVEELRPYVAWCTGYRQAGVEPTTHRGLPSPWLTMIVTLDEQLVIARHPDPRQPASTHDFLLGGLHTAPALVTHDGWQSGIQLALTPPGARALLGMPAAELASIDVEAADVLGRLAGKVRERVLAAPDWAGRFAVLEEFLTGRVRATQAPGSPVPRPEVSYAWDRLRQSRGADLLFRKTLSIPSREWLRADVDEALVMGASALDEELLALRPAVEVPHELGVAVR
jgi:hypothetical protein